MQCLKNKIFMILIILLSAGCAKQDNIEMLVPEQTEEKEEIQELEKYIDDNPITIGIYDDNRLIKESQIIKESRRETILSFYYTNEENLENIRLKDNWNRYYLNYTDIDDYKIGFSFSFYVGENKIQKTILKPNTFAFEPYFYIYLYDDVNQPDNTFYSHLEETDINENTVFSSIKIFLMEPYDITSPIKFTVFTYNDMDDFDENNNYRGNSKYEININLI